MQWISIYSMNVTFWAHIKHASSQQIQEELVVDTLQQSCFSSGCDQVEEAQCAEIYPGSHCLHNWVRSSGGALIVIPHVKERQMNLTKNRPLSVASPMLWDTLPAEIQQATSLLAFKWTLKIGLCSCLKFSWVASHFKNCFVLLLIFI